MMLKLLSPISDGFVTGTPGIFLTNTLGFGYGTVDVQGTKQNCNSWLKFRLPLVKGYDLGSPNGSPPPALLRVYSVFNADEYDPNYGLNIPINISAFAEDDAIIPVSFADYNSRTLTGTVNQPNNYLYGDALPGDPDDLLGGIVNYSYWQWNITTMIQNVINRAGFSGNVMIALKTDATYTDPTGDPPLDGQSSRATVDSFTTGPSRPVLILTLPDAAIMNKTIVERGLSIHTNLGL